MSSMRGMGEVSSREVRSHLADALVESGLADELTSRQPSLTDNAQIVLERRYLAKDRTGRVVEAVEDMFQQLGLLLTA